jgi:hypothetical protein
MADLDLNVNLKAAIQQYAAALEGLTLPTAVPATDSTVEPTQPTATTTPEAFAASPQPSEVPATEPVQATATATSEVAPVSPQPLADPVLAVLLARDRVQAALAAQITAPHPPADLSSLSQLPPLDQTLKAQAVRIAPYTQAADWRTSFNPNPNAWWWFLEAPLRKVERS